MTNSHPHIPSPFLKGSIPIERHRNHLPHWQQGDSFQFVTWSLGDALPARERMRLMQERCAWLGRHKQPWSPEEEMEYYELFSERVSRWLDAGSGCCLLRSRECSHIVRDSLLFCEGTKTHMDVFVVMPNHVHALFLLKGDCKLETVLQGWKSFTSHEINRKGLANGKVWMPDYWDRMVRSIEHYWHVRNYILRNPAVAGLSSGYCLWEREKALWLDMQSDVAGW